jgi:hypothetical protein
MNQEAKEELIKFFFNLKNNLYLYHLSTYSYSRHIAIANLLVSFDKLIDNFLETFFGKYGRPDQFQQAQLNLTKLSDSDAYMELSTYIDFLTNNIPTLINEKDADLFNIRDEMVGILNNTRYLFELK